MSDETWTPPRDTYLDKLGPCKHCGEDFFKHMHDGEPPHQCPPEHQNYGSSYGFFHGGDPRDFHPDYESCSPEEVANHKRACEEADRAESARKLECPSGWVQLAPDVRAHILRAPFGIGVTTYPPTCYEPEEKP